MKVFTVSMASIAILSLSACTTTGNVESNAALGALGGAVAGAIIGNNTGAGDAKTGAAIGAIIGGAGGAAVGAQKDRTMGEGTRPRSETRATGQDLYYDEEAQRYYYFDPVSGRTYYENGELRG